MNKPGYSNERRRHFIRLLTSTDRYWVEVMGDSLFHDLNYYDLFTQMWLTSKNASRGSFRKSDLYRLMPNISQRTAIKYIQIAIDHGLLIEHTDAEDLRSRRVAMSPGLKRKIELFLDYSIAIFEALAPSLPEGKPRR